MPRTRPRHDVLHTLAYWLLLAAVICGPAGLGGTAAFADAWKACGIRCPCDDEVRAVAADEDVRAAADGCDDSACFARQGGGASKEECPDNCSNCGCCLRVARAVLPLAATAPSVACPATRIHAPVDGTASGVWTGIFRPPRSLA